MPPGLTVRRRIGRIVSCTRLLLVVAVGCGSDRDSERADSASTQNALEAHEWVLDRDVTTPAVTETVGAVTLAFGEGEVSGTGPCNGFRAGFSIDGDEVEISEIALTPRSWGEAVDEAETTYVEALAQVGAVSFEENARERLELSGDGGISLVYDSIDAADLLPREWHVVSASTEEGVESVPEGVEAVVDSGENGELTVTGLCNTMQSSWELDGDHLVVDPAASTLMACDPPEVARVEAALGAALGRIDMVAITPRSLTAYDATGATSLVAWRHQS